MDDFFDAKLFTENKKFNGLKKLSIIHFSIISLPTQHPRKY